MKSCRPLKVTAAILLSAATMQGMANVADNPPMTKTAIFAGGCFWCIESDFEHVPGVVEAISGYANGETANPTYADVSAGGTGYVEAVKVVYDPTKVSYSKLLDVYWHSIDPTVEDRQFCDIGDQYRTGIYYQNEMQKDEAIASLEQLEKSGRFRKIYTEVEPLRSFYSAEQYHQDYYKKNPIRYAVYRYRCGRDQRLEDIWGS